MSPVQLHLKEPFYHDYLALLFKNKKAEGKIVINGRNSLGRFIHNHIQFSDTPKQSWGPSTSTIFLHLHDAKKENTFVYFDELNTNIINRQIDITIDYDFTQFCLSAHAAGIKKKDAIQMFIRMMNLKFSPDLFDMFKKRDYRRRRKIDEMISSAMKLTLEEVYVSDYQ
jgi:hypothetical protein